MNLNKIKLLLLLASFLILFAVSGYFNNYLSFNKLYGKIFAQKQEASDEYFPYYYHKKSFFEENGILAEVVMIGDSITDEAEWHELFPNLNILNRGVGGDTTRGVLERLDSIVSTKASKAFLMIGINDITCGVKIHEIKDNYLNIIDGLIEHNIAPYIISTLLVGESKSALNEKVQLLNNELRTIAYTQDVEFINLNRLLSLDGTLNKEYSLDGLHLNGRGYKIWSDAICEYLTISCTKIEN